MKYVVIGESSGASRDQVMEVYPQPQGRRRRLRHLRGEVVGIGPFGDGGNMAIFRSQEAAEAFAQQDPFILEGLVASYAVRPWFDEMLA